MTIRQDLRSYVTSSDDGLHYNDLNVWMFDDGEELGNYIRRLFIEYVHT